MTRDHALQAQEVLNRAFDATYNDLRVQAKDTSYVRDGEDVLAVQTKVITANQLGQTEVVAAEAGKRVRVLGYDYGVAGIVSVKFQSGNTDITGLWSHGANGEGRNRDAAQGYLFQTVLGAALNINLSAAIAVGGVLTYCQPTK